MRVAAISLAGLCALALGACGDTLQNSPISHSALESLIEAPFPVYWVGDSFRGMQITETTHDPADAYTIQYGDCLSGGQAACVPPLRVVSSPDNGFLPGGSTPSRIASIRGVRARVTQGGRAIVLATGGVVLDVYAKDARLALAAAETAVAINQPGAPLAALPKPLPDTGFDAMPLPSQVPAPLRALG